MAGKKTVISQFDDSARRRIANVVRQVEQQSLGSPPTGGAKGQRGLQVRYGITDKGPESAYTPAPANVFYWKPLERRLEDPFVGDREITDTPWEEGHRVGVSIDGGYIPHGIICKAYLIGRLWRLDPLAGLLWGESDGAISARSGTTLGGGSVIVKSLSLDDGWASYQVDGLDLTVAIKNAYTSSLATGKTVIFGRDATTGTYGLVGGDC